MSKRAKTQVLRLFLQGLGAFYKVRVAVLLKIKARLLATNGKPTHQLQHAQNSLKKKLGARILQDTGTLAMSITKKTHAKGVSVGTNLEYAAIHQFGGKAGRNHKVQISARPFLPINKAGELPKQTATRLQDALIKHLGLEKW